MASHIEMSRTASDPVAVRSMARGLLIISSAGWTDWELDFLEHLAEWPGAEPLSERQREKLFELRDNSTSYAAWRGLSIASLVRDCWIARLDLVEEDAAFIEELYTRKTVSLKRRQLGKLVALARQLNIIEEFASLS